ncbi:polysaccharide biosynthesis tyrosine autokinase [candidate division WOR-3 bacterium]|nr:polysaccharide biosynthesis tyrosine autokinase [candidate division WOR-3 bacterium]
MEVELNKEGDIKRYIKIIKRRLRIVLGVIGGAIILSVIYIIFSPPLYTSSSSFMIRRPESLFADRYLRISMEEEITNHLYLIKTEPVVQKAAYDFTPEEIEKMEFDSATQVFSRIKSDINSGRISIGVEGESRIIKIKVIETNPYRSSFFANQLAKTYRNFDTEINRGEAYSTRRFIESQLEKVKNDLKEAEEELKSFKEKHGIIGVSEEIRNFVTQMGAIETEYRRAQLGAQSLRRELESVRSMLTERQQALLSEASETSFQIFDNLKLQLAGLERERADLMIRGYSADDEKIISIENSINIIRKQMSDIFSDLLIEGSMVDPLSDVRDLLQQSLILKVDYTVAKTKEDALESVLSTYQNELKEMPMRDLQLARLERERIANEKLYLILVEKKQQSQIEESSGLGSITILNLAKTPGNQNISAKLKNCIIILFLGVFVGIGVGFVVDYMDSAVRDSEEVIRLSNLPELASIPLITTNEDSIPIMVDKNYDYHLGEAIRRLRTNIKLSKVNKPHSSLLIASPNAGCGKSIISINLAISFASSGNKVLLVDTDLRRPAIEDYLQIHVDKGLSELLKGDDNVEIITFYHGEATFFIDILPSGILPENPSELLDSDRMSELIAKWRENYDIIIFDSPPLLMVSDGFILGSMVDKTLLVVACGETTREMISQTIIQFNNLDISSIGFVINKAPLEVESKYYYHKDKKKKKRSLIQTLTSKFSRKNK